MNAEEYKEVAEELESILRVWEVDDERIARPLREAIQSARVRHDDLKKGSR